VEQLQLVEYLTLEAGSRDPGFNSQVIFRNNFRQFMNVHLLRSTKPSIPTGLNKLVPASARALSGESSE
jgi:hypothetical protein